MDTTQVLEQLNAERHTLAIKLNALTHAVVGLGGKAETVDIYVPASPVMLSLPATAQSSPVALPHVSRPTAFAPPMAIFPDGYNPGSYWKDKILFILKKMQSGYAKDIAKAIRQYEPHILEKEAMNNITWNASVMAREKIIGVKKDGFRNRYFHLDTSQVQLPAS